MSRIVWNVIPNKRLGLIDLAGELCGHIVDWFFVHPRCGWYIHKLLNVCYSIFWCVIHQFKKTKSLIITRFFFCRAIFLFVPILFMAKNAYNLVSTRKNRTSNQILASYKLFIQYSNTMNRSNNFTKLTFIVITTERKDY